MLITWWATTVFRRASPGPANAGGFFFPFSFYNAKQIDVVPPTITHIIVVYEGFGSSREYLIQGYLAGINDFEVPPLGVFPISLPIHFKQVEVVVLPAHGPLYEFVKFEQAGAGRNTKDTVNRRVDVSDLDFDFVEHGVNLNNNPSEAILQHIVSMGKKNLIAKDLGGYVFWQSIPLALLRGLLSGETKPNGATISAVSGGMIIYKIPKFKEEVTIPDSFAGYLRSIGSIDEMVSMGIMTDKVTDIVKSESGELEVEQKASLSEEKGRDSKKARAFQLFSQGKGPSSPEVKTLGLHKSTRFKYYNQYLTVHKP